MQRSCAARGRSRVVSAPARGGHGGSNSSSEQPVEVESSVASTDASLRTRGATQGIMRKLPLGSKKRIHVHKKIFIEDEARSTIGAIFRANMNFPFVVWSSWKKYPEMKEMLWQKYLMVDVWATTKWQEKSRCAKTNRSANDEPSHTGGSVPHAIIGVELKEKMPEISEARLKLEVYELTHKLKRDPNGQPLEDQDHPYVSKKAKAIRVSFSQEPNSSLVDYDAAELWRETPVVRDKKGRIRGTRETARDARASMRISLDQSPASENWKDEIAKIVQLEVQKMKETEIAKIVEIEVEKRMKEKELLQVLMQKNVVCTGMKGGGSSHGWIHGWLGRLCKYIDTSFNMSLIALLQGKVTATDATEDDNDDTFDELGG
ncbi:hypothetical protein RJ639_022630 [Escallonia herrerae]|uniref:Uncharacterized protein n=1 Tax=Escallonia herrerae TaxID=1293975 RepID=A0AA88V1G9_9ASTE|nr:hypothetical protein RJ639_022630 [Escallonia herrerae]